MKYNRYSVLTTFGHICTDINQGALPALLPFLVYYKDISYASAAGLIFAANSMSSFIQPLFGYLGDRVSWPWLMGLGAFLAGGGLALVGFLDNYWAIFIAVTISGIGIAIFHPEGGKMANLAAGENKGAGMGFFAVGGSIGFVLGPIMASVALTTLGLRGTAVFLIPAISMVLIVLVSLSDLNRISRELQHKKTTEKRSDDKDDVTSFVKVSVCLASRSVVTYGMTTFVPLYFVAVFMLSAASAGVILALYSLVAAVSMLLGGNMADRFGFNRVIRSSFLILAPIMLIFPLVNNFYLAVILLVPLAIGVGAPIGPMVALGQTFLPNHIGMSSGIMLGIAVSVGGMFAPGIGWVGDQYGLPTAIYVVAAFAVLTLYLSFLIPDRK